MASKEVDSLDSLLESLNFLESRIMFHGWSGNFSRIKILEEFFKDLNLQFLREGFDDQTHNG